jgi:hypothetical protein
MTGKTQTLSWGLVGKAVKTTENKIHWPLDTSATWANFSGSRCEPMDEGAAGPLSAVSICSSCVHCF